MRMQSNRNSHLFLVEMENGTATLEDSLAVSYKIKHTHTMQSSHYAPWYSPKRIENLRTYKTCVWMFIATLFITVKLWKQSRCSLVSELINKL